MTGFRRAPPHAPYGKGREERRPDWLEVQGFKSFGGRQRLTLRNLTLVAGPNSGGKSALLQPLLLIKQTLEADYDVGPLRLDGPHVRFTQVDQLLTRGTPDPRFEIRLGPGPAASSFPCGRLGIALPFVAGEDGNGPRRFSSPCPVLITDEGDIPLESLSTLGDVRRVLNRELLADSGTLGRDEEPVRWSPPALALGDPSLMMRWDLPGQEITMRIKLHGYLRGWVREILHLPGARGHRDRTYAATSMPDPSLPIQPRGPFTPYTASCVRAWQEADPGRVEQIERWLQRLGLTGRVVAQQVDAVHVELKVGRWVGKGHGDDLVDLADVGFGVSEVLPVLTALAAAWQGQVVYLEQPEIHLHPRALVVLGKILAEVAAEGVTVIVETHSRLLLRGVQLAIAKGLLSPSDTAMHWVSRDERTGWSRVDLAELGPDGSFGEWPVDFAEVEAAADDEWLDAVL